MQPLEGRDVVAVARRDSLLDRGALATGRSAGSSPPICSARNSRCPRRTAPPASNRPFGPFGDGKVQHCSATFGASRTATAQAEGGLKISAPSPEISAFVVATNRPRRSVLRQRRHQLLEPFQHLPRGVGFDRDIAFLVDQRGAVAAEHRVDPGDRIVGDAERQAEADEPALAHFSAAVRKKSQVHCRPAPCRAARRPGTSWSGRGRHAP